MTNIKEDIFLKSCLTKLLSYHKMIVEKTIKKDMPFKIFSPSGDLYDAIWPDDFTFSVIANSDVMSKKDYQSLFDFLTKSCIDLPQVPDRVQFDGLPIMQPGAAEIGKAHGDVMPAHLASAWVRLLSYLKDFGVDIHHKNEWYELIKRSYEKVTYTCGLVYINPQKPSVAFAYNDCAAITGFELMCSIVNMRGFERALVLFNDVIDKKTKSLWERRIVETKDNLWRLYDVEKGGFVAGSEECNQFHIWANGLMYSMLTNEQKKLVSKTIIENYFKINYKGFTRQMIEDSGWHRLLVKLNLGDYMNGGYWPTGSGYIMEAVYCNNRELGMQMLNDLIEYLPKYEYTEWINKKETACGANYFHMAVAMPIVAIKAMLEGKSLLEMF